VEDDAVGLADGRRIPAASVILATGLEPRIATSTLPADPRIIDAWDECALAAMPRRGHVMVLGSGLTALDVIAFLHAHGFRGTVSVVSRHGLMPALHGSPPSAAVLLPDSVVADAPRELRGLLRWGRAVVSQLVARGARWQDAIDAIRPHVSRLWRDLPPHERARFVRSIRPYWDVLRHRAPQDVHALVESWQRRGRLERVAGTIESCRATRAGLDVTLRLSREGTRHATYDAIIRCLGPALARTESEALLVQNLVEAGYAAWDPAGLGIVTDPAGRIVDREGKCSDRIFALGALRRASNWETTSVPDISAHAAELSRAICS
jgi:uncharacterized NAD(P)/FAD-binding protein YdhS